MDGGHELMNKVNLILGDHQFTLWCHIIFLLATSVKILNTEADWQSDLSQFVKMISNH